MTHDTDALVEKIARAMWGKLKHKGGFENERPEVQVLFLNDAKTALEVIEGEKVGTTTASFHAVSSQVNGG